MNTTGFMNRRQFAKSLAVSAATALPLCYAPLATAADAPSKAPFQLSVMLWTVLPNLRFEQRLEKVAEAGYGSVELVEEYEKWTTADFRYANDEKRALGLKFDSIAAVKKGAANPGDRDAFLSEIARLIPVAEQLECPAIIVLSGNKVPTLSHAQQHESCIETLQRAGALAAKKKHYLAIRKHRSGGKPRVLSDVGCGRF